MHHLQKWQSALLSAAGDLSRVYGCLAHSHYNRRSLAARAFRSELQLLDAAGADRGCDIAMTYPGMENFCHRPRHQSRATSVYNATRDIMPCSSSWYFMVLWYHIHGITPWLLHGIIQASSRGIIPCFFSPFRYPKFHYTRAYTKIEIFHNHQVSVPLDTSRRISHFIYNNLCIVRSDLVNLPSSPGRSFHSCMSTSIAL